MKRGGRPRIDAADRLVPVTVGLPRKQFDALCRLAFARGLSLPEVIRRRVLTPQFKNLKTP